MFGETIWHWRDGLSRVVSAAEAGNGNRNARRAVVPAHKWKMDLIGTAALGA